MANDGEFIANVLSIGEKRGDEQRARAAVQRLFDDFVRDAQDAHGRAPGALERVRSVLQKLGELLRGEIDRHPGQKGELVKLAYQLAKSWRPGRSQ
jgi:hypothetical protein